MQGGPGSVGSPGPEGDKVSFLSMNNSVWFHQWRYRHTTISALITRGCWFTDMFTSHISIWTNALLLKVALWSLFMWRGFQVWLEIQGRQVLQELRLGQDFSFYSPYSQTSELDLSFKHTERCHLWLYRVLLESQAQMGSLDHLGRGWADHAFFNVWKSFSVHVSGGVWGILPSSLTPIMGCGILKTINTSKKLYSKGRVEVGVDELQVSW